MGSTIIDVEAATAESKDPMYYHPIHASEYIANGPSSPHARPPLPPLIRHKTRTHESQDVSSHAHALPQTPHTVALLASLSSAFMCPISQDLMKDPVVDPEGNSYERAAIMQWLRHEKISPLTRSPLQPYELRPNRALRAAIVHFEQLQRATRHRSPFGQRQQPS